MPLNNRLRTSTWPQDPQWRSRGYLPHFESGTSPQLLTIRLADTLPTAVLAQLEQEVSDLPQEQAISNRRERLEEWLDRGAGACWLAEPRIAQVVEGAFQTLNGNRYDLHAWVIMPNHVHVLISPIAPSTLAVIAHSLKSFTAKEANRLLGRTGAFWQREYYDRAIRNLDHFHAAMAYIEGNPVKAGLCAQPEDWPFSSARRAGDTPTRYQEHT